jgi:hypothetical protein
MMKESQRMTPRWERLSGVEIFLSDMAGLCPLDLHQVADGMTVVNSGAGENIHFLPQVRRLVVAMPVNVGRYNENQQESTP